MFPAKAIVLKAIKNMDTGINSGFSKFLCLLCLLSPCSFVFSPALYSQEGAGAGAAAGGGGPEAADGGEEDEAEDGDFNRDTPITRKEGKAGRSGYAGGDKNVSITVGVLFPLGTGFPNDPDVPKNNVKFGGTGALSYTYFVTPYFFAGGEIQGSFSGTEGGKWFFMFPAGAKAGVQFVFGNFEVPLSFSAGLAPQAYDNKNIAGMYMKPAFSVFYRFSSEWSFGLNAAYWWVAEWPKDSAEYPEGHTHIAFGNFMELTVTARYHF